MVEHEKTRKNAENKVEQHRRLKKQESESLSEQHHDSDEGTISWSETPFIPRMDEHAATLSRTPFSAQRQELIMRLNNTYGYRYVQRIIDSMNVQAKLTVNAPNDIYEQEADRVADDVTRAINSQPQRQEEEEEEVQTKPLLQRQAGLEEEEEVQAKPLIQRQAGLEEEEEVQAKPLIQRQAEPVSDNLENSIKAARGNGHPLPDSVREPMERAFKEDFSGVRVHTDSEADMQSRQLSAKAFTTGQDIFFREGEYSPGSDSGRELIAHELTHTVQQTGGKKLQRHTVEGETQMKPDTPRIIKGSSDKPEMESGLQKSRGSGPSPDGSVQRMAVIVNDNMDNVKDALVWNNLEHATRQAPGAVGDLSTHKVWDKLKKNEAIRLVEHGSSAAPTIGGKNAAEIVKSMTEKPHRLKAARNIKISEVTFQSCYAGTETGPGPGPHPTLVGEMKTQLEEKGYHGVTVKGRKGIAFGFKGMGGKTAENEPPTPQNPYTWDAAAETYFRSQPYWGAMQGWGRGKIAYWEAMYLYKGNKTKTTNVDIFKTPFIPAQYNDPWILLGISEAAWDSLKASDRSKRVADEMEDYWGRIEQHMQSKSGFKPDATSILSKITSVDLYRRFWRTLLHFGF